MELQKNDWRTVIVWLLLKWQWLECDDDNSKLKIEFEAEQSKTKCMENSVNVWVVNIKNVIDKPTRYNVCVARHVHLAWPHRKKRVMTSGKLFENRMFDDLRHTSTVHRQRQHSAASYSIFTRRTAVSVDGSMFKLHVLLIEQIYVKFIAAEKWETK